MAPILLMKVKFIMKCCSVISLTLPQLYLYRLIHWPENLSDNVNNQYMGPKGLNNDYQLNQNAHISFFKFLFFPLLKHFI